MSYINKKSKVFREGRRKQVILARSEARMKDYFSSTDARAWSTIVEERRQHILEYAAKNKEGFCFDNVMPLDILVDAMMACKNAGIKKLEKKIKYLEKMLDIYSKINLTADQQRKLNNMSSELEKAYDDLESLECESGQLKTVFDKSKRGAKGGRGGPSAEGVQPGVSGQQSDISGEGKSRPHRLTSQGTITTTDSEGGLSGEEGEGQRGQSGKGGRDKDMEGATTSKAGQGIDYDNLTEEEKKMVIRDADGNIIGIGGGEMQIRDADGNIIGIGGGEMQIRDADGNIIGTGGEKVQIRDADGNIIETEGDAADGQPSTTIRRLPDGTIIEEGDGIDMVDGQPSRAGYKQGGGETGTGEDNEMLEGQASGTKRILPDGTVIEEEEEYEIINGQRVIKKLSPDGKIIRVGEDGQPLPSLDDLTQGEIDASGPKGLDKSLEGDSGRRGTGASADFPGKKPAHRCANIISGAQERCAKHAVTSGGVVSLPGRKRDGSIPRGYLPGDILPNIVPPQKVCGVQDWQKCKAPCGKMTDTDKSLWIVQKTAGQSSDLDEQPREPLVGSKLGSTLSRVLSGEAIGVEIIPDITISGSTSNIPRTLSGEILNKRLNDRKLEKICKARCAGKSEVIKLPYEEDIITKELNLTDSDNLLMEEKPEDLTKSAEVLVEADIVTEDVNEDIEDVQVEETGENIVDIGTEPQEYDIHDITASEEIEVEEYDMPSDVFPPETVATEIEPLDLSAEEAVQTADIEETKLEVEEIDITLLEPEVIVTEEEKSKAEVDEASIPRAVYSEDLESQIIINLETDVRSEPILTQIAEVTVQTLEQDYVPRASTLDVSTIIDQPAAMPTVCRGTETCKTTVVISPVQTERWPQPVPVQAPPQEYPPVYYEDIKPALPITVQEKICKSVCADSVQTEDKTKLKTFTTCSTQADSEIPKDSRHEEKKICDCMKKVKFSKQVCDCKCRNAAKGDVRKDHKKDVAKEHVCHGPCAGLPEDKEKRIKPADPKLGKRICDCMNKKGDPTVEHRVCDCKRKHTANKEVGNLPSSPREKGHPITEQRVCECKGRHTVEQKVCVCKCRRAAKEDGDDLPSLIIHKDAEILALKSALAAKEAYCAEQRKIAAAAIEQLENIKNIVEERDDLRKKLESSQNELEDIKRNIALGKPFSCASVDRRAGKFQDAPHAQGKSPIHIPFNESRPTEPNSCEEEISALEKEIEAMRSGNLTPDLEAKVIRKEVEVLKKYCGKLSTIQKENHQLKSELSKYEEAMNLLGFESSTDLHIDDLKQKLEHLNETVQERDILKNRVEKLEKELYAYNDLPEDIEVFKQRSILLDEVLQDRDRLSRRVEQLRGIDEEVHMLRKRSAKVDELEEKFKSIRKEKKSAEGDLEIMRIKCSSSEIEALNQKTECDTLRSKLVCKEQEVEILKSICKEAECLRAEKSHLQQNLDDLMRMQGDYDHMCTQMKCLEVIKAERNMYKSKYDSMIGLECECDILRAQVERAKCIERERDTLEAQVEDFECCIAEQEDEIRRLVCHIDVLAQGRDEQQDKLKGVLTSMRAELEIKESIILSSEEKLATVQEQLRNSIEGLSGETTHLRNRNEKLEKDICHLKECNKLLKTELKEKEGSGDRVEKLNIETESLRSHNEELAKEIFELKQNNELLQSKINEKDNAIKILQEMLKDRDLTLPDFNKIQMVSEDQIKKSVAGLQNETANLKTSNEKMEEEINQLKQCNDLLQVKLKDKENAINVLQDALNDRDSDTPDQTEQTHAQLVSECDAVNLMKYELEAAKAENKRLQQSVNQMGSVTGDEHLQQMLRQSKVAIQRIAQELSKQYEEWDCIKLKLKEQKTHKDQELSTDDWDCKKQSQPEKTVKDQGFSTKDYNLWDCYKRGVKGQDYSTDDYNLWDCMKEGIDKAGKEQGRATDDYTAWECRRKGTRGEKGVATDDTNKQHATTDTLTEDEIKEMRLWDCKKIKTKVDGLGKESDEENEDEMHTARSSGDNKKRIEELETELAQANKTILQLQDRLCVSDRVSAENAALRRHSSEVQEVAKDQIEDLVEHLKKAKEKIAWLEGENMKLISNSNDMKSEKEQLMIVINELQTKRASDAEPLDQVQKELEKSSSENAELQKKIGPLESQLSDIIPAHEKLKEQLQEETLLRQNAEEKLKEMENKINESDKAKGDLQSENENLKKKLQTEEEEVEMLKQEKENMEKMLTTNVVTTSRRSSKLENDMESLVNQNKELQGENEKLSESVKLLENEKKDLSDKLSSLAGENKNLHEGLDKISAELEDSKDPKVDSALVDTLAKENENLIKEIENQKGEICTLLEKLKQTTPVPQTCVFKQEKELKEKDALQSIINDLENQLRNVPQGEKVICVSPKKEFQQTIDDLTKRLEAELNRANAAEENLRKLKGSDPSVMLNEEIASLKQKIAEHEMENSKLTAVNASSFKEELDSALNEAKQLSNENANLKDSISNALNENNELRSNLEKLKQGCCVVKKLKDENEKLQNSFTELENENANLKKDLDQASNEVKKAFDKVSEMQDENGELKQNLAKMENENSKLKKDLEAAFNDAQKLSDKAVQLEKDNLKDKQDISNLESENDRLKKELDSVLNDAKKGTSGVSELQDELAALKQKLSALDSENSTLKGDLDAAISHARTGCKGVIMLKQDNEKLKQSNDELERELASLKQALESAVAEAKMASSGTAQYQNEMSDLRDRLAKLESENSKLKGELNIALDDAKRVSDLQDQDALLKQKLAALENENSKLKKDFDKVLEESKKADVGQDDSKLRERIEKLEAENAQLKKDLNSALDDLKNATSTISQLQGDDEKLKQKLALMETENSKLKKNLDQALEDARTSASGISQLRDDESKLKQRLAQLESENSKLKQDLDNSLAGAKNTLAEQQQFKDDNENLRRKLAQLENDNQKLKGDLDNYIKNAKSPDDEERLKQRLAQLEAENNKLKKDLETAKDEQKNSGINLSQLQDELAKLKQKHAELEKENSNLRKDYEGAMGDFKKSAAELALLKDNEQKLKQQITQLQGDNNKLSKDITALNAEISTNSSGLAQIKDNEAKLKQRIAQLEDENAKLKKQLDSALDDSKKSGGDIAKLRDDDAKMKQRLAQLEAENAKLKGSLDTALADAKKGAAGADEQDKLRQKLAQLEADNNKLKTDLNKALDDVRKSAADVSKLRDDDGASKQKMAQLENENSKLKKDLEKALADAQSGSTGLTQLRDENNKLKQRIGQLEGEISKLKIDLNSALESAKMGASGVSQMQDDDAKLKQRLSQLEKDNAKLKGDLESALKEAKGGSDTAGQLKDENSKQKQKISQLESELAKLRKDLEAAMDKGASGLSKFQDEEAKLKQRLAQLESENSKLKKDLDAASKEAKSGGTLKEENEKLKQRIKQLEAELEKMKSDLNSALDDAKKGASELSKLRDSEAKLKQKLAQLETDNSKLKGDLDSSLNEAKSGSSGMDKLKDENANLKQKLAQLEKENSKLKKDLEAALNDVSSGSRGSEQLKDENSNLKQRLAQLEKENAKLKKDLDSEKTGSAAADKFKGENDTLKQRIAQLEEELNKLKSDNAKMKQEKSELENNLTKMKGELEVALGDSDKGKSSGLEDKIKQLQAELAKQKKECSDTIGSLKEQFDRDMRNLLKKNEESIAKLQKAHEDLLKDLNEKHDNELKSIQDALRKAKTELEATSTERDKMKNLLDDQRKKSIEIKNKVEQVESVISRERSKSKELKRSSIALQKKLEVENSRCQTLEEEIKSLQKEDTEDKLTMTTFENATVASKFPDVIAITAPLSENELKFYGKQSCACDATLETVIDKLSKNGIESLSIEELQMMHKRICDATANVLEKLGQSTGVLKPNETNKLSLMKRIAALEGDLLRKQKHAQQKVTAMQYAVQLEKDRLNELKKSLDNEKQKNSLLLSKIGTQSKVVSNIQEERDLIQRQKSYHEEKLEQYIVNVEEERAKTRNMEDELDKEKTNNRHLKNLLEAERDRARQNKRKDTETLEIMRIKLEKTLNSEMMLRMKLNDKVRRRSPSPGCAPVRDSPGPRATPSFYTDLSAPSCGHKPKAYTRVSCPGMKKSSSSSNGLDSDGKK